jgi:hypothetical protein
VRERGADAPNAAALLDGEEEGIMERMKARFALVAACTVLSQGGCGGEGDMCARIECSDHGTCYVDLPSLAICRCDSGYHNDTLVFCEPNDPVDPCRGVTCTGHGTCVRVADQPTCHCDDGYHPSEREPTVCLRDSLDAVARDDGETGDVRDEAGEEGDGTVDEAGDAEAEVGPVCGNGVVESGEACERGQSTGCQNCGHQDCRSDCSDFDSTCLDQGRCNPGEVWSYGECGTMTCWVDCTFPWADVHCGASRSCSRSESSVCGRCGTDLCFRSCPGTQACTDKGSMIGCTFDACVVTGAGCTGWRC